MALTENMEQNFANFYNKIKPYLNGGGMGMKLLWENSDPTQSFAAQNITLSSDDYDMLMVVGYITNGYHYSISSIGVKGDAAIRLCNAGAGTDGATNFTRDFIRVDNTHYSVSDGKSAIGSSAAVTDNTVAIPYRIYGIKVYNRDVQSDYEIIDGTIDSIGTNVKKTYIISPTIPTGKKVIGWSIYTTDSDLQSYMTYYGGNYILCVKNSASSAMSNKGYRVVFIYGQ